LDHSGSLFELNLIFLILLTIKRSDKPIWDGKKLTDI